MAEEEKTEAAPAAEPAPSGGGGNKLVVILVAVNTVITLGMIAVLFLSHQKEASQASVQDIALNDGGHGEGKEGEHGEKGKDDGHGGKAKEGAAADGAQKFGRMITLEQFTINLSTVGTVNPKFARVNISVEVPTADAESEINQKMPQVRNTIIDLFNSKRPADLATSEGRNYLKDEIKNALNSFLVTGKVKGVYFTNFAVSG